jgi:hypothetical protein
MEDGAAAAMAVADGKVHPTGTVDALLSHVKPCFARSLRCLLPGW